MALDGAIVGLVGGVISNITVNKEFSYYFPLYNISPQEIFSDQVPALHVNFINPKTYEEETEAQEGILPVYNSAKVLGPQISKWYVALRNLVLVGLMVVLLYIGIRIVISSTAGEKAKYKEHIKDWIIAVILVVFMHYIMAFALTMTEYVTNILVGQNSFPVLAVTEDELKQIYPDDYESFEKADDGNYYIKTNLMGYIRFHQQRDRIDDEGNIRVTWSYIGYTILYLVLVIYTVMFVVIYLKRVIYMAFLTVIAPLVALTYPIDKISDGKAQAFDMWIKEYVYNLLLQPFHLLLYTLLVGSVMELAQSNIVYAIVVLGFLVPAEKLLRKFFGFEKAPETGSIVGGVVGGSLAMNAINRLGKIGPGSSGKRLGGGNGSSGNEETPDNSKIRTADKGIESGDDLITSAFGEEPSKGKDDGDNNNENTEIRMSPYAAIDQGSREESSDDAPNGYMRTDSGLYIPNHGGLEIQRPNDTSEAETSATLDIPSNERVQIGPNEGASANGTTIRLEPTPLNGKDKQGQLENQEAQNRGTKGRIKNAARKLKEPVIAGAKTAEKYVGKIGTKAPRLVTKAALAATLGTAGVAAGVATGDWSNIATYGAAAAAVGSNIGDNVSNTAGRIKEGAGNVHTTYMQNRYTRDELKKKQNDKLDEDWMKSKDTIKMYKEIFGKDYEEAMKDALEYRRYGVTDDKVITKVMRLNGLKGKDSETSRTSKERIALAKAASKIKDDKGLKDYGDRLKDNGISDDKIKEVKGNIRLINDM